MKRVAVVGAGFGGLGAALALAEGGHRVVLYEALKIPGGCAQTFARDGVRFDAGATLTAGLSPSGLFTRRLATYGLTVPLIEGGGFSVETPQGAFHPNGSRQDWIDALCRAEPAHTAGIRAWCGVQARVADTLWPLFETPDLLPPINRAWWGHLSRLPALVALLPHAGTTLAESLRAYGLSDAHSLRAVLDGLCQITVQGQSHEVDALTAMAAIDYGWRGVGSPKGGMGTLAEALLEACRRAGVDVRLANRVQALARSDEGWRLRARGHEASFDVVVANLLPEDTEALLGRTRPAAPPDGWGAAMHYLVVRDDPAWTASAQHAILRDHQRERTTHGHQVFASLAERSPDRAPSGLRALTLSTHVEANARPDAVAAVQARMLATLAARWPSVAEAVVVDHTASPRTFARFLRRSGGYVGGPVRRPSWRVAWDAVPRPTAPNAWRVGDSGFPGQSTLATFIGGERVAAAIGAARR